MPNSLARAARALALVVALAPAAASAQEETASSAFYVEMGGSGLVYSVNYEGRFTDKIAGRFGLTFVNRTVMNEETGVESVVGVTLVPVMGNVLLGSGSNRLELGAGPLFAIAGSNATRVDAAWAHVDFEHFSVAGVTSAIGYRYQRPQGGLMMRATITPFYSTKAQVWGGISMGWAL